MVRQASVAAIFALGWALASGPAVAAEETAASQAVPKCESAKRACKTSKGQTREECEKVAAKIDAQTANPDADPQTDDSNRTSSQDVHHSSPAMRTPEEVRKAEGSSNEAKRQDEAAEDAKSAPKQ